MIDWKKHNALKGQLDILFMYRLWIADSAIKLQFKRPYFVQALKAQITNINVMILQHKSQEKKTMDYAISCLSAKTLNFEAFTHSSVKYNQRQPFHDIILHPNSWNAPPLTILLQGRPSCKNLLSQFTVPLHLVSMNSFIVLLKQTTQLQQCLMIAIFVWPLWFKGPQRIRFNTKNWNWKRWEFIIKLTVFIGSKICEGTPSIASGISRPNTRVLL